MIQLTPQQAITLAKEHFDQVFKASFHQRKELIKRHGDTTMTTPELETLADFLLEHTGVCFTQTQLHEVFCLFPYEKACVLDVGVS